MFLTRRDMCDQFNIMNKLGSSRIWIKATIKDYFLPTYLKTMCDEYEKRAEYNILKPVKVYFLSKFLFCLAIPNCTWGQEYKSVGEGNELIRPHAQALFLITYELILLDIYYFNAASGYISIFILSHGLSFFSLSPEEIY